MELPSGNWDQQLITMFLHMMIIISTTSLFSIAWIRVEDDIEIHQLPGFEERMTSEEGSGVARQYGRQCYHP